MMKKAFFAAILSILSVHAAFGDWHRHRGHGDPLPDLHGDSFVVTGMIIIVSTLALLSVMGPVLVVRARKISGTLWMIPAANLALYIVSIALRPYPGGFAARFALPGLEYTILELLLLLLLSMCAALIIAAIQWARGKYRSVKAAFKRDSEGA